MFGRATGVAAIAVCTLLINTAAALAAGDPTQVGQKVEDIVSPNVKSFWKIGLLVAIIAGLFTRKYNVMGVALVAFIVSGAIIYNPAGFGDFVSNVGHRVL